ncbi:MAG: conserved membrane protein of unknown function [Promethearchaeota archaeon]|nr:MAG: conserved membrane protein of unknown function [Candidatus Lokiarchaeota archaeon]
MFYLFVVVLDFIIVCFMGYYIIKSWNKEDKDKWCKINEIIHALLTMGLGFYYPLYILEFSNGYEGVVFPTARQDFIFFGNLLIVGLSVFMVLWALSAKIRTIRNPELLTTQNNYRLFRKDFIENYGNKNKIRRKYIHTIPFGVVGSIVIICFFLSPVLLGERWLDYARFIITIVGVIFAFTFIIGDLVRLLDFSYMPPIVAKWFKQAMTRDELDTFTSTSVMVFGFGPFLIFKFQIFIVVLLITAVADAFASLFGLLTKNKHHFPKNSKKTIEGYIGGVLASFICTVFAALFSWFFGLNTWSIPITLIVAFIMALTFLVIDLATSILQLQDNYLNPLICGGILLMSLILLGVPIY